MHGIGGDLERGAGVGGGRRKVLLFGGLPGGTTAAFDATRLHYGEVDLVAAFHYCSEDVHAALALLASGAIRPRDLITAVRPLDAIVQVFHDLDRGAGAKYAIVPDGTAVGVMRPTSTTAAVYHAAGDLRLEELPLPPLERGEMLIRVGACGLCPGEIMDWYMQRKAPVPLGHEPVGEVIDVTDGVAFRPGDRVFVHHHAPCLVCRVCARGDFVHCPTWRPRRLVPGGLATHAIVAAAGRGRGHDAGARRALR